MITTKMLADALIGVLETEKYGGYSGCGFCDSGRLRKPSNPERQKDYDHQYDCPYKIANEAIQKYVSEITECAESKNSSHPSDKYQRLFNWLHDKNFIALQPEMQEVIDIIHEDFPASLPSQSATEPQE